MKLIQVSDMHIKSDTDISQIRGIIDKMVESLKDYIGDKEEIVFCILGDIIDKGNSDAFSKVKIIIEMIKECFINSFPASPFSFEFVPGNHDLVGCDHLDENDEKKTFLCPHAGNRKPCNFNKFDEFISEFQTSPYKYSTRNFFIRKYKDIDLLLLNSATEKCEYGKIDFDAFNEEFKKPTIIITHHALMSLYDSDSSAIRKGNAVLEKIRKNNVIAMLHGHAHGYFCTDVGLTDKCIVGVGPFLKEIPVLDVAKQFNIFDIRGSSIFEIKNFTYRVDDGGKFLPSNKPTRLRQNNFSGSSIKKIYDDVVTATKDIEIIRNLRIHLNCKYEVFKEDINKHFKEYIEQAVEWQADKVNRKWYFNHGERMRCKDKDGLDYIIDELRKKPTSSRAIIPLMNFSDIIDYTDDDDKYLPSLISVQFGFNNEPNEPISELICTVYLRSLEVANFLKINLCEVFIMCEKIIKKRIRDIQTIDLHIFAFRTVHKLNFGCFRIAELDRMARNNETADLFLSVHNKNVNEIVKLLEEKRKFEETKIIVDGIYCLKNILNHKEEVGKYTPKILELIEKLLHAINNLKEKRINYSVNEVAKEEEIVNKCLDDLIEEFKKYG